MLQDVIADVKQLVQVLALQPADGLLVKETALVLVLEDALLLLQQCLLALDALENVKVLVIQLVLDVLAAVRAIAAEVAEATVLTLVALLALVNLINKKNKRELTFNSKFPYFCSYNVKHLTIQL